MVAHRFVAIVFFLLMSGAPARANPDERQRLLVYYANETAAEAARSDNYAALLAILRKSANPAALRIAQSVENDARKFAALAARDERDLLAAAARIGFDLAIFTNARTFAGHYLHYRHAHGTVERRPFPALPPAASVVLATAPLGRQDAFRAALTDIAARYPAGALDMILIANSHGSGDMALMPRVNTDLSTTDAASALAQMLDAGEQGNTPTWATLQGTSKLAFWAELDALARSRGVRFPLVFREACASGLRTWQEFGALPAAVGIVAHSGMGDMDATVIDYAAIFAAVPPAGDWLAALERGLASRGIRLNTERTLWFWVGLITLGEIHVAYYFVPVGLWLGWFALHAMRSRHRAAA